MHGAGVRLQVQDAHRRHNRSDLGESEVGHLEVDDVDMGPRGCAQRSFGCDRGRHGHHPALHRAEGVSHVVGERKVQGARRVVEDSQSRRGLERLGEPRIRARHRGTPRRGPRIDDRVAVTAGQDRKGHRGNPDRVTFGTGHVDLEHHGGMAGSEHAPRALDSSDARARHDVHGQVCGGNPIRAGRGGRQATAHRVDEGRERARVGKVGRTPQPFPDVDPAAGREIRSGFGLEPEVTQDVLVRRVRAADGNQTARRGRGVNSLGRSHGARRYPSRPRGTVSHAERGSMVG